MGRERLSRALDRPKFDYGSQSAVATGLNDGLAILYGMNLECGDSAPLLTGRLDAPPSFNKSGVRQGLFLVWRSAFRRIPRYVFLARRQGGESKAVPSHRTPNYTARRAGAQPR